MDDMPPHLLARAVGRLRAIADENRVRILMRLRRSPANVSTLAGELGLAQPSVSKHLAVLKGVGLVEADRIGTQAVYRVRDASVFDMCKIVCDGVIRHLRSEQAALESIESATAGATSAGKSSRRNK